MLRLYSDLFQGLLKVFLNSIAIWNPKMRKMVVNVCWQSFLSLLYENKRPAHELPHNRAENSALAGTSKIRTEKGLQWAPKLFIFPAGNRKENNYI